MSPREEQRQPDWVKEYLKKGVFAFSKESVELLNAARIKYSSDWIAYLGVLRDSLKGPKGVRVRPRFAELDRRISDLQDRMRSLSVRIGRLVDYLETPSQEEVGKLFEEIRAIEEEFAGLVRIAEENKEFMEVVENWRMQTGLDLRSLQMAHKLVEGRIRVLKIERPQGFLRTAVLDSPMFAQFRDILWGMAGPVGILAKVAIGKYRVWRKERREAEARRRWEGLAPEIGRIAPDLPEEVLEAYMHERAPVRVRHMLGMERIRRGEGAEVRKHMPGMERISKGEGAEVRKRGGERISEVTVGGVRVRMEELPPHVQEWLEEQARIEGERGRIVERGEVIRPRTVGRGSLFEMPTGAGVMSLFQFFDKDAYRARWTTEVLNLLKGIEKRGAGAGVQDLFQTIISGWLKNLLPTIIGFIKSILPVIIPIVAVGLSALAGWLIGRFISQLRIGGRTVGERVQQGVLWLTGGTKRQQLARKAREMRREGVRPEVVRALELQAKGVPIRESVIQARRELGIEPVEIERRESIEPVPQSGGIGGISEAFKEGNREISSKLDKLIEGQEKKSKVSIAEGKERIIDVYNIRDPYLEELDKGVM